MNETLFVRRVDELNQKSSSGCIVFITWLSSRLIRCAKLTTAPASNDRKDKGLVMRIVEQMAGLPRMDLVSFAPARTGRGKLAPGYRRMAG